MRMIEMTGIRWSEEKYRRWVMLQLSAGDDFKAPRDLYTQDRIMGQFTKRTVVEFFPHYVLTVDEYGKTESYQYHDIYLILRGELGGAE